MLLEQRMLFGFFYFCSHHLSTHLLYRAEHWPRGETHLARRNSRDLAPEQGHVPSRHGAPQTREARNC
jgi:hypothetical protein